MKILWLVNLLYVSLVACQENGWIDVLLVNEGLKTFIKSSALIFIGIYNAIVIRNQYFPKPPKKFPKEPKDLRE